MLSDYIQEIIIPRRVAFGPDAVQKIPYICEDIGIKKLAIFSGGTHTKQLTSQVILPQIEDFVDLSHFIFPENVELEFLHHQAKDLIKNRSYLMAVGGGKTIDYVKVIASLANSEYLAVPTNASHDGFSSPYVNFILREQISQYRESDKFLKYSPISPLAIIGDTNLISQAPKESLSSGVGDSLSKWVAVRDWKLAHRLKGSKFDTYAATFSEMTANMVEERVMSLKRLFFSEIGVRVLMKALGSSGVAMCIAGSSRPASGSEHLISHALDKLAKKNEYKIPHGHQTGLASILMMYLHGDDWNRIRNILLEVNAPITLKELGIDRDIMLEAIREAQKIRPDRYTILAEGLTKKAAIKAIEMTGID
ncbi:MAG: iron-containing alcohol dehydrogenase [Candidatus Hodarchaeales archaeon]|jgi:glycerol-1-phosphate dehydrogenase [NAD(P)+]